jgi:hypothetical protein
MIIDDMGIPDSPLVEQPRTGRTATPWWLGPALWSGRALLILTVTIVFVTWLSRPQWITQGVGANGYPNSGLPTVALILVLAATLFGPWLCGLATSPEAAWREGDILAAATVLGRRRVSVPGAFILWFRVPGRTGTSHAALLVDRRLRPLLLFGPMATNGRSRIDRLVGRRAKGGFVSAGLEYLLGIVWLLTSVAVVFLLLGVTGSLIGAF